MATQSRIIWSSDDNADPAHHKTVTMFWDDVTLLLTQVVVDNTLGVYSLPATATVVANGRTFSHTTLAGDTFTQNIGTSQATRFQLFINPDNGRLDGVDWRIG
jgi:hypothetical protein